jgi:hypothetical protein
MAGEVYVPQRLRERGVRISIPIEDPDVWRRRVESDRGLPANYAELSALVARYSPGGNRDADDVPRVVRPLPKLTCGESIYARIRAGLANPGLNAIEREAVDASLADTIPTDWNSRAFDPFLLHWTETDPNPDNNFDPQLVDEAGALLQLAWSRLTSAFGTPALATIEVKFQQLGVQGQSTPPSGPIVFDTRTWLGNATVRAPLAAHELFHLFQYSFGFRQAWPQSLADSDWFGEGTARWAEVFVHQRLTAADWLTVWMAAPASDLLQMGDYVLPFWIFLDARFRPDAFALSELLTNCQNAGDLLPGLDSTLASSPNGLAMPDFFALYAAESFLGRLRRQSDGNTLYPSILAPDGLPVDPRPAMASVLLEPGNPYQPPTIALGSFGSNYQTFSFPPAADGLRLVLHARAGQDLSFQTLSFLHGAEVAATPVDIAATFDLDEVIQLSSADTVVVIASSRGTASSLDLSAELD